MTTAAPTHTKRAHAVQQRAKLDGYHTYAPDLTVADEMKAARQAAMDDDTIPWTNEERLRYAVWFYSGWYMRKTQVSR